jgi:hypothetical protein
MGQGEGYEIRKYAATKWVHTVVTDVSLQKGTSTGFRVRFTRPGALHV